MSSLVPGEEWTLALDSDDGLSLLVLAYANYFDFHVLTRDDRLVASVFGYCQRVRVLVDDEHGSRLDVGGAVIALPSTAAASELALRVGVGVEVIASA